MKNKNLWLSLIIAFGIVFLLTWVIPSTNYDNSGALVLGNINPTGIWDVFYYISMLPSWFSQSAIYLAFLAIFYGVISKTGALRALVDRIAGMFKKREKMFLAISSAFFIVITSLTGITFPLLIFVPLVMGVILTLGFNKITALVATVVSILAGVMGSMYASTIYTAIANYVEKGVTYGWYKLILIVISLVAVELFLHFTAKLTKGKEKEEINEEMLFIEKTEGPKKPKVWPLVTALIIIFVLFVLGLTPWANMFKFTGFTDLHEAIMGFKIGSFAIVKSIFGASLPAFGAWDISDAATLIGLLTVALIFIYKIKWEDVYKGALNGLVKFLPTIILVLVVNFIFVVASQSGVLNTIVKGIAGFTKDVNVFTYSFVSFIGAVLVNENYITSYVTGVLNTTLGESANLPLLILIQQVMYGLAMFIAPTSVMLLVGLSYLEVSYTKWVKNIWKLMLILTAVGLIILMLAVML